MSAAVEAPSRPRRSRASGWLLALLPLLALALLLSVFALGDPLALFKANLPPIESLTFERIRVVPDGFEVALVNGGPDPVKVAQVLVDDAYWAFQMSPSTTIPRLGRAQLHITYPWVEAEPHAIRVITSTGLTFDGEVELATLTPTPGLEQFAAYGLLGVYVGIIPVALGMLWFPAMRRMGRRWLGGILALTLGLLFFLLIDTFLEALEVSRSLPAFLQGVSLTLFAALFTWLGLLAVRSRGDQARARDPLRRGFRLAALIALGIGLHNLGEGLAIGAAFALGEAALGSFLVIGFTLHNVTEGIGIAAPLLPTLRGEAGARKGEDAASSRSGPAAGETAAAAELAGGSAMTAAPAAASSQAGPRLATFFGLTVLAGSPAILGAWIGGFAFSPTLATLFLGIGAGAIWQVIAEVADLLGAYARQRGESAVTWINVGGFALGVLIMYLTAFLVSF
jgi:zinc transporter ZupT